jgi:hypothetical protein
MRRYEIPMAILRGHVDFYRDIFALPGFLAGPLLTVGFQDIIGKDFPEDFRFRDVGALLRARGVRDVTTLDLFDARADLRLDLNDPVPAAYHEKYATLMDIGSLEHCFDAAQCMENCIRMVKPGGFYFLETPVNGCFRHGFHTFNPDMITGGFAVRYLKYISFFGVPLARADQAQDALIVIVGQKAGPMGKFTMPQQSEWKEINEANSRNDHRRFDIGGWPRTEYWIRRLCPPILLPFVGKLKIWMLG